MNAPEGPQKNLQKMAYGKLPVRNFRQWTIRPFSPEDQEAARRLILNGLQDHWGVLDPAYNHDLDNIAESFHEGLFLVAYSGDKLVGTGAILPRNDTTAEIVRMSVSSSIRRTGLGQTLVGTLIQLARKAGFQRLILETTQTWEEVIAFYRACGFVPTHFKDGDIYFEMILT